MEILFTISYIVAIVVCGYICDTKKRTVWKGLVAGFFLGWIGVVICAFLDDHSK